MWIKRKTQDWVMPELLYSPTLCQLSTFGGSFCSIFWGIKRALGNSLQSLCTMFCMADFTPFSLFHMHAASCTSSAFICEIISLEIDVCPIWAVLYMFILRIDSPCLTFLCSSQQHLHDFWTTFWINFVWLYSACDPPYALPPCHP